MNRYVNILFCLGLLGAAAVRAGNSCNPVLGDSDRDGHSAIGACEGTADDFDDSEPLAHPGHPEIPCDGIDNDGDHRTPEDEGCVSAYAAELVDAARELTWQVRDRDLQKQLGLLLDDAALALTKGLAEEAAAHVREAHEAAEGALGEAIPIEAGHQMLAALDQAHQALTGAPAGVLDPFDPWTFRAGSCSGQIGLWYIGFADRYTVGDFDDDGRDEILAVSSVSDYEHVIDFDPAADTWTWRSGSGNGAIDLWYLGAEDQYVSGNWDGDTEDELLAVSYVSGYEHVIEYDEGAFAWDWRSGSGNGAIDLWYSGAEDKYVAGDWDDDNEDELLAVSYVSGYEHVIEYDESANAWDWRSGSGNGAIDLWYLGAGDKYLAGDFDGDGAGELLAVSSASGYEHVIDYSSNTNQWRWKSGSGNGAIDLWPTDKHDDYLAGDFDGDGVDELLAISPDRDCWEVIEYHDCADPPDDMVGWWTMDEASGTTVGDHAGGNHGTLVDGSWLDSSLGDFTIIALPDTQYYSRQLANNPSADDIFSVQTQWIVASKNALDTRYVVHLGDITENDTVTQEWVVADNALTVLDNQVPYALAPGNHDGDTAIPPYPTFNVHFPPNRYQNTPWYQDHLPFIPLYTQDGNQNSYHFFEVGGLEYGILALEFDPATLFTDALPWASTVVAAHPDRLWIVITHSYLGWWNGRTAQGAPIWSQFVHNHPNVSMVLSGHIGGEGRVLASRPEGAPVMEILTDYQFIPDANGNSSGLGYLRYYRFEPRHDRVTAITYSPYCDGFDPNTSPPPCDPWDVSSFPNQNMDGDVFDFVHPMSGKVKSALRFDGADDYVTVPDDPSLDIGISDFTVDAWVRPRMRDGLQSILDKRTSGGGWRGYHAYLHDGRLGVQLADGTYDNYEVPPSMTVPLDNEWHFVAVTVRRGLGVELRVDGTAYTISTPAHTGSLANSAPLLIGGHSTSPSSRFWGDIDEVEIFDRALAAAELDRIYDADRIGKCK